MTRQHQHMAAALALSLLSHLLGYFWWGHDVRMTFDVQAAQVTRLAVRLIKPAPPAPITPAVQAAAVQPQPSATPRPPPPPKPVAPQSKRVAPLAQPTPAVAELPAAIPAEPVVVATPPAQAVRVDLEAEQERYLRQLFAHIERHKFYPAAARRQGMEATVQVSFKLNPAGRLSELNILGGPKLLRHAAEETLRNAAPLPTPPAAIDTPLHVEYLMAFALD